MASYTSCRLVPKSSRNSACVSFPSFSLSSCFVGKEQRRKGLRTGGMPPAVFNELSGPAAGDKRERQGGRVLAWIESCYYSLWKRRVVQLGLVFQSQILSSGLTLETAGSGVLCCLSQVCWDGESEACPTACVAATSG